MSVSVNHVQATQTASATKRLLVLSWLVVVPCIAKVAQTNVEPPAEPIGQFIDPNAAPWWELTVLPEIGPSLARRIVDHREAQRAKAGMGSESRVFRTEEDLNAVAGIGPRTIARLMPYLQLEEDSDLPDAPRATDDQGQSQ